MFDKRGITSMWRSLTSASFIVGVLSLVVVQARPKPTEPSALSALDYAEIEQLNNHYAHALDTCADKGNELADLFAPDGTFTANGLKFEGRERLIAVAGGPICHPPKNNPLNIKHFAGETMIEPSPNGAIGKSYVLQIGLGEDGKGVQLIGEGKYYDVYVKTPAGWRFKSRDYVEPPHVELIPVSEQSRHLSR